MKTTSQVAELAGISARTLQYYDEIGLLKPSALTSSGYRLYDGDALQRLQQILFFKELGFTLKEIKEILEKPNFDKIKAFKQQKELLLLKRNRLDKLVKLLGRLEKGEQCMSFKEFDLSEYIEALERFQSNHTEDVIKHWGSAENFNQFIQKVKADESKLGELAIRQFGSIEKYTDAMKYNLEHFSEITDQVNQQPAVVEYNRLYSRLTSDMEKDVASDEIQSIVHEFVTHMRKTMLSSEVGSDYWDMVIGVYSNDVVREIVEQKYGSGASSYIPNALRYYFTNERH